MDKKVTPTSSTKKKKQLDKKEKSFKIKDMMGFLYTIKTVILAFASGLLLGLSIKLEQLQLITLKSVVYGVFIFLVFDVSIYYLNKILKRGE